MTIDGAGKVTFLLGAGASVDAGLPVSVELTRVITQRLDTGWGRSPVSQALHVAIGAIVAHDTARGKSAYDGIDVERIFASIQMLARRNDHELTPFVAAWSGGIDSFGANGRLPAFWGGEFRKAVHDDRFGTSSLERKFKEGVEALARTIDSSEIYRRLEQEMIESLVSTLEVSAESVEYLSPLLRTAESTTVQIATLNYDNSVELLAKQQGADLDTGIESWLGGYKWSWRPEANVRLLKLHGSLDWRLRVRREDGERIAVDRVLVGEDDDRKLWGSNMGVVFGQGSKLRADGPFLAMLIEFDRFLESTEHLVIVGYSMRDEHINAALRRWVVEHPEGRLSIVDPGFPDIADAQYDVPFQRDLVEAFCEFDESGSRLGYPRTPTANLVVIRKGARDGLAEVFERVLPGFE
ncbi:SIR2 family protein [Pseudarthrobacter polychromogenes]|uniref:SIR2-like domain-containing protein n=1 Tax=Pseudarthrobacter polychromogenes TaxID=1676 RepID=A0ABQ1XVY9_9MICC|nr:SIR2 family protein [Pseudarthrobacter polychromogenes]GGH04975.1 hypothetical protein GCM10011577_31450 [Pseudarthrobacter polychromogenes]